MSYVVGAIAGVIAVFVAWVVWFAWHFGRTWPEGNEYR